MSTQLQEATGTISKIGAIRDFFQAGGGRPVTMDEVKALTQEDRNELAPLCAAGLGKTLTTA
jgi:hypothetical protein